MYYVEIDSDRLKSVYKSDALPVLTLSHISMLKHAKSRQ